jgi:hypothetical protein
MGLVSVSDIAIRMNGIEFQKRQTYLVLSSSELISLSLQLLWAQTVLCSVNIISKQISRDEKNQDVSEPQGM